MSIVIPPVPILPATEPRVIEAIFALERISLQLCEQTEIPTRHLLHAGMYARTIEMPPGTVLTGALMKVATTLIVCGHVKMLFGSEWVEMLGYNVLGGNAGRKQVFESISRTWITMVFPTDARSPEEAEEEFTDQADELMSRKQNTNTVTIVEA